MKPEASSASSAAAGVSRWDGGLEVAVGRYLLDVGVPGLAEVDLEVLRRRAGRSSSKVHLTSAAVNGLPSCHFTPSRRAKVSVLPSSLQVHLVARSGTMPSRLFCGQRIEHDEVVEHAHRRHDDRHGAFLVDRHAGGTVAMRDAQHAALLLGPGAAGREHRPARTTTAIKRKHADKPNARMDRTRSMTAFLPWRFPASCRCGPLSRTHFSLCAVRLSRGCVNASMHALPPWTAASSSLSELERGWKPRSGRRRSAVAEILYEPSALMPSCLIIAPGRSCSRFIASAVSAGRHRQRLDVGRRRAACASRDRRSLAATALFSRSTIGVGRSFWP